MKKIILIATCIIISACSQKKDELLTNLNGYWTIDKVELSDGSERELMFSNHMDHFALGKTQGVKNRVSPAYDGTFINYESPVNFKWQERDGALFLLFNDGVAKFEQEVIKSTEKELILLHNNGTRYFYTRYTNEEQ